MTIRWPEKVLAPRNVSFDIASRTLAGPSSVSGATQVVSSDAGIWRVTFDSIVVNSAAKVLTWRAISNLMEGRLGSILVPFCRGYQPVADDAVAAGVYDPVPHSDGAYFSDTSGYVSQGIDVTLKGASASRSVSATITIGAAGTIQPGQHFSLGERAYRLRTVVYNSDTEATITFRPPLREAASDGDRLEFDDPVVRCRLAGDDEMALQLDMRKRAFPSVNFVEDV